MTSVALTMIGDDRTGLVSALSAVLAEHDGNWLDSRMARLAGKFAGIALVDVPDDRLADFERAAAALTGDGLEVTTSLTATVQPQGKVVTMQLVGTDRPGIVAQVTQALASLGASIENLTTGTAETPMAGGLLFHATADVRLADGVEDSDVRAALEPIADELMIDLSVHDADREPDRPGEPD